MNELFAQQKIIQEALRESYKHITSVLDLETLLLSECIYDEGRLNIQTELSYRIKKETEAIHTLATLIDNASSIIREYTLIMSGCGHDEEIASLTRLSYIRVHLSQDINKQKTFIFDSFPVSTGSFRVPDKY